jgi:methionyl-tRNA formyltransferase
MRLVLMGTGPFAVPSFTAIHQAGYSILSVITRPDRSTRGKTPPPNPARQWADTHGFTVHAPDSINSAESQQLLRDMDADLFFVCDYGQILSRETLGLARLGGINLHGSLLPRYRGAAPIQWAIYQGETETGVTVIHMTPQLDAGPCLVQLATPIGADETNVQLEPRLAELGVQATLQAIQMLAQGSVTSIPQDKTLTCKAPRLTKEQGLIRWENSAQQLFNQIRAWVPWPKSYTNWSRGTAESLRIIIDQAAVVEETQLPTSNSTAGTIIKLDSDALWIRCGQGALAIQQLQPAGKKSMSAAEFIRGYKPAIGDRWE